MKGKSKLLIALLLVVFVLFGALPGYAEEATTYYWPLDDNFVDTSSGVNFSSEANNFVDGAYSGSRAWDSTGGGYGETAAISVDASSFTVSAWFNIPSSNATPWNAIFSSGTLRDTNFIELYYSVDGNGIILRGSVGTVQDVIIAKDVETDKWHHAALSFDGTTKALKGYLDGTLMVTQDASSTNYAGLNDAILYLGLEKTNYVMGQTFIDDLRLTTRAYSDTEIADLYSNTSNQEPVEKTYDPVIWIVDEENDAVFGDGGGDVFQAGPNFTTTGVPYESQDGIDAAKFVLDSKAIADPYVAFKVKQIGAYHYAVLAVKYVTDDNTKTPKASIRVNASGNWIMNDNVKYVPGEWTHILVPLTGEGLSYWPPEVTETYKEGDLINEIRVLFLVNGSEGSFEGDSIYFKALGFFYTLEEAQAYRAFELSSGDPVITDEPAVPVVTDEPVQTTEPVPKTGDASLAVLTLVLLAAMSVALVQVKKRVF